MPRFSVYVNEAQYQQVKSRWPDFNFSHALRLKLAEVVAAGEELPLFLCEHCGRRVRWFGPPKRRRSTAS